MCEESGVVVLSSDEEEESDGAQRSKEPVVTGVTESPVSLAGGCMGTEDDSDDFDQHNKRTALSCRVIFFGSYMAVPKEDVLITENGMKIKIHLQQKKCSECINIYTKDIIKILLYQGQSTLNPVIFYYLTYDSSIRIRQFLGMNSEDKEFFYDPTSTDEFHKRIVIIPKVISNDTCTFLKTIYERWGIYGKISWIDANEILGKTSAVEFQSSLQDRASTSNSGTANEFLMLYPPPPAKGGITINTDDYSCLVSGNFINDVVIDFYLRYLWENVLSEYDKERTFMFSSFFYKRLSTALEKESPPKKSFSANKEMARGRRHQRVKGWTKTFDLFSKDFVIIPINKREHWYLAIICFPGLSGSQDVTSPCRHYPRGDSKPKGDITCVKDVEMNGKRAAHEEDLGGNSKQDFAACSPCILFFDSIGGSRHAKVCTTLREYLQEEWDLHHEEPRAFTKQTLKASFPSVPRQTNNYDCGLYLLQYVEAFFTKPMLDFKLPIKSIKNWFPEDVISRKRYEIMELLLSIMKERGIDPEKYRLPSAELGLAANSRKKTKRRKDSKRRKKR